MLKLPEKDPLPVNELARALDKNVATIYRWGSRRGVRGHRLRLTRIGGRTVVERCNWDLFWNALNNESALPPNGQPKLRDQGNGIDAELDAAGF